MMSVLRRRAEIAGDAVPPPLGRAAPTGTVGTWHRRHARARPASAAAAKTARTGATAGTLEDGAGRQESAAEDQS